MVTKNYGGFTMKKGKIWIVGLIALLLAGGLILASCGERCGTAGGGYCGEPNGHGSCVKPTSCSGVSNSDIACNCN
jgi:hypothetical protein